MIVKLVDNLKNNNSALSWAFFTSVVMALAVGFYWRIINLGTWPLTTDEFYMARSVEFLLARGVPEFPFGGYYTRGLAYQYLAAPFIAAGASPEWVLRALSVGSSILVLPAAFFVMRDAVGRNAAWVIVIILALSTWQIEMARFGRMYAPFQAVFVWYLYHLYFLIIRDETWRWKWLIGLSLLSPLVWEGGIFLAVLNLIPFLLRFSQPKWVLMPICFMALMITIGFNQIDFRYMASEPAMPDGIAAVGWEHSLMSLLPPIGLLSFALSKTGGLIYLFFSMIALGYCIWRLIAERNLPWFSIIGLMILSVFALTQQLMLSCLALVLLVAGGWIRVIEWRQRSVRLILIVNAAIIVGWIVISSVVWEKGVLHTLRSMLSVPNFEKAIVMPSIEVLPDIALILIGLVGLGLLLLFFTSDKPDAKLSLMLVSSLISLSLVAIAPTQYYETRYFFFAYPLLLILGLIVIARVLPNRKNLKHNMSLGIFLIPFLFLFSSDFHFSHLRTIGSYDSNFRIGYSDALVRHYHQRYDHRAPGEFIDARVKESEATISTITPVSAYISRLDAIYLDKVDSRYRIQAYSNGQVERWSSARMLSSLNEVSDFIESHGEKVWLVVGKRSRRWNDWEVELIKLPGLKLEFTTLDDVFEVYSWTPGVSKP